MALGGLLSACFNPLSTTREISSSLPLPTKDDVALVDGRPFTISAYNIVKNSLQKRPTKEVAFWVGTAAIALQNHFDTVGRDLSAEAALEIAFYAVGEVSSEQAQQGLMIFEPRFPEAAGDPEKIHEVLNRILSKATVQRNPQVLAEL